MSFQVQGFTCRWTPYAEGIVTIEEGQTREQAMEGTLSFFAEQALERYQGKSGRFVTTLTRMPLMKKPPELAVFLDTDQQTIWFGTEAEMHSKSEE